MALPFDRQRQLELEAEAELELEQEMQSSAPKRPLPFAKSQESQLGADQSNGFAPFDNIGKAIGDLPEAAVHMGKDLYNLSMPFDALAIGDKPSGIVDVPVNAGPEKVARTVGPLAAGTAGALSFGPWGSFLGLPGVLGAGALGFGAGMLGFDIAADVGTQLVNEVKGDAPNTIPANPLDIFTEGRGDIKPLSNYMNDFAYNSTQAGAFNTAGAGLGAIPKVGKLGKSFTKEGQEINVGRDLNKRIGGDGPDAPPGGGAAIVDQALAEARASGVPESLLANRSLGEILADPVLKNEQRVLARSHPESYGRAYEKNQARNDAQLKYLDNIEQSQMTAGDAQGVIRQGAAEAQGAVDAALSRVPLPAEAADLGSIARQEIAAGRKAQGKKVTEGFEGAGDAPMAPEAVASVVAAMQESIGKHFREVGPEPGSPVQKLIAQLTKEGEPTGLLDASGAPMMSEVSFTVKDLAAARSKARKISKSKGDQRDVAVANEAVRAIDKAFEEAVARGEMTPEQATSLDAGIAARREQGNIYEARGKPTKAVLSKEYSGDPVVPDSSVLSRYWRPGNKGSREAAQNYKEATKGSPQAIEAMHQYAATSFRRFAVDEGGIVNAKRARDWLNQHADALKEFPEIAQQFGTVEKAQRFLNETFGDLKRPRAEVESGALQMWLKDIDPKVAIREMLSGQDAFRKTRATYQYIKSKDPTALAGLRRGIIDHLKERVYEANAKVSLEEAVLPDGPMFDGRTRDAMLGKAWNDVKPALEKNDVFTKDQMLGFDHLYKDKASQMSVEQAKMPSGSDSVQNLTTLGVLTKIARSSFLKAWPRTGWIVSVLEPMIRTIPEGKFLAIMEEALLNPIYARELMAKATAKNITKTASQIFKEEMAKAGAPASVGSAAGAVGKAAMRPPQPERDRKPTIPKQQTVTAKESFPDPKKILRPPAPGKPQKVDISQYTQNPETMARIQAESSGNPEAVSPKGAQGLSQLMPATAAEIAAKRGETYMPIQPGMTPEEREASIKQNVQYGDIYYKQMLGKFKNPTLARAAYNAGPKTVNDAIKLAGTSRDVNKILSNLPKGVQKETIPYTEKIPEIMARLRRRG